MSKDNFVKGAAILSVAGLIMKILGAVYRIPLTNLIGTQGMGYYQPAYTIYNLLLTISLVGFPTAISRLVSEKRAIGNYKGAYQVYKVSLLIMILIGLVTSSFTLIFSKIIVNLMGYPDAYYSLLALVPAILVIPILSTFRGFFQGTQNMIPTAVSQLVEQVLRVIIGLVLAYFLVNKGLPKAAGGATFGASVGAIVALIVIVIFFIIRNKTTKQEISQGTNNKLQRRSDVVTDIIRIAIPITIGASIAPLMAMLDGAIISSRLTAVLGYTKDQVADLYGTLTPANTMINFPQVFSMAIVVSLLPILSESFAKKEHCRLNMMSSAGIKIALILSLPCGVGMFLLATPIIKLLYSGIGVEKVALAGNLLTVLSVSVIFFILSQTFTTILQAVDKQVLPVKNLFIGLVIKVVTSYILVSIPTLNIKGSVLSTAVSYFFVALLNYIDIKRHTVVKTDRFIKIALLPLLSTLIMGVVVVISYKVVGIVIKSNSILTLFSIMCGGVSYLVALFLTGAINKKDLELIPMGHKLEKFAKK